MLLDITLLWKVSLNPNSRLLIQFRISATKRSNKIRACFQVICYTGPETRPIVIQQQQKYIFIYLFFPPFIFKFLSLSLSLSLCVCVCVCVCFQHQINWARNDGKRFDCGSVWQLEAAINNETETERDREKQQQPQQQ